MVLCIEIVQQKNIKDTHKDSKLDFQSYIDKSPDGIFITDSEGKFIKVNRAGCSLLGYNEEELLQKAFIDFLNPQDISKFIKIKEAGYAEGEVALSRKDGTKIFVDIHAAALENSQYIGFVRDITNRKIAEQALSESEEKNNLIINGISDIVILYEVVENLYFKLIKTNNNFYKYTGYTEEQVLGNFIEEIFPDETAKFWNNHLRGVVRTRKQLQFEKHSGLTGTFDVNVIPIVDRDNNCTHIVLVAHDIAEKVKLEEYNVKMEKLESIGMFAGGIAHDFNNFLTVMLGNISLAMTKIKEDYQAKDKILHMLSEAETASRQAKNLTQQLLTFAKGGEPICKASSIEEILRETATFALRGSNILYEFHIAEGLWTVEIDEGQINQVINNLIINAKQAMPGGGKIKISTHNMLIDSAHALPLSEGKYVKISIKDNGIGISKEILNKIFEPYFSTKTEGNGLGLATCYSIIKKHGGCITVESEDGAGTTFHIYLPASQKEIVKSDKQRENLQVGKGKILIMDDEQKIRTLLSEMLAHLGYEAICASDGKEAIELYQKAKAAESPFDLVILDLTIPGGFGGKETLTELLKLDSDIKAIVSSGYSNDSVLADYIEYGFKAIISKPYKIEEVGEVIHKVLIDKAA